MPWRADKDELSCAKIALVPSREIVLRAAIIKPYGPAPIWRCLPTSFPVSKTIKIEPQTRLFFGVIGIGNLTFRAVEKPAFNHSKNPEDFHSDLERAIALRNPKLSHPPIVLNQGLNRCGGYLKSKKTRTRRISFS